MKPQIVRAGVYALVALGLLLGVHQVEHLVWPAASVTAQGVQPAFYAAGQPQAGDVSFVAQSAHDCQNGALLINDTANYAKATKVVYVEPDAKGAWTAKSIKGHTVTVKGVPLTDYTNPRTNKVTPEYHVDQASQISVQ
jgi:hypothetical protein